MPVVLFLPLRPRRGALRVAAWPFQVSCKDDAVFCRRLANPRRRSRLHPVMSIIFNMFFYRIRVCGSGTNSQNPLRPLIFRQKSAVQKSVENVDNSLKSASHAVFMSRKESLKTAGSRTGKRLFPRFTPLVKRKCFTKIHRENVLTGELFSTL